MKIILRLLVLFLLVIVLTDAASAQKATENPIYLDYNQSFKARVDDLLSRMTLEEKLSQMMTRIPADLKRFGIPGYQWGGEAGHCVLARSGDVATIFPQAIAQAATWNRQTVWEIANAMSDESRARANAGIPKAGLTFWAPVVEMARDPRWGRTEECYGEDPFLTSRLGLAFVKGLQGDHPKYLKTIAAPKHFAANNEEWCRHNGSSDIDEQLLREYYLRPYQVLVEEGKAEQIMAAYNRLNGVPCVGNKLLLTDILRNEWGFDGNVVSDCNGIKDLYEGHKYVAGVEQAIALALNSGMDIECGDCFKASLAEVVKKGLVSESVIDTAVRRILVSRFRLGLYDPPDNVPFTKIPHSVVDGPENREIARKAAREAIVLLKNESDLLPLDVHKIGSVAVIGPNAAVCRMGGYTGPCSSAISPLEGILNRLDTSKVHYVMGTDIKISLPVIPSEYLIPPDAKPGEHGLRGEYFSNTGCSGVPVLVRIDQLIDFNFGRGAPDPSLPVDYFSIRWTGKFIAPSSGSYYIGGDFDDAIILWFDGKKIIDKTLNRNRSSEAVKIEIEAGRQYDIRIEYTEQWYNAAVKIWGAPQDPDKFNESSSAAGKADVAIVVLGTDESVEKEGVDRSDLNLPGDQEELVKAVFQANPKTIVVLQNGSALAINWLQDHVPAILETWYNGEEAGNALADVIFGDYNPGGRLPLTFYKSSENFPSISDYDIRKGRTYLFSGNVKGRSLAGEILYPFGYGLSYTQFRYGPLEIVTEKVDASGSITARIMVENTGKRPGDEVVQLYACKVKSAMIRPGKQLVGFERISLYPGEKKTVEFVFPAKDLAFWNVKTKAFVVEPGVFNIMAGSSSKDVRAAGKFIVQAKAVPPNDYTRLVDPFIGTAGDGNTYPGASVPFGGVQLSPDTNLDGHAIYGGYYYPDSTIFGFSHTHLSGVGEPEYRDVLLMPTTGKIALYPGKANQKGSGYYSAFSHKNEVASPGYYQVMLSDYQVKAELTATLRCGFHRYTFPKSDSAHIIIDLAHPGGAEELYIKKVSQTEIEGLRRSHGWAWDQYVYFVARFSKPFSSIDLAINDSILPDLQEAHGKNVKAVLNFQTKNGEAILVKVGISAVSVNGARMNLDAEIPDWNFDKVVSNAKKDWNKELSKIEVSGGTPDQQKIFYTSLYHTLLSPNIFMDVDGQYRGVDHQVHEGKGFTNYTVFSLWDTFRALHPLFTIINQNRTNDFVKSLLSMYTDGGRLPMWPLAGNYTDDMLGYHAVPVIVDAWLKGIRDYDVDKAFTAIKHSAGLDKLGLKYYKKLGYLPYDRQGESVSKTLEYSYDDWCIAQMAKSLGAKEDYNYFNQRAHFWENVFDTSTGFMRGRAFNKSWLQPFDPLINSAYSEGNAWQYMFVPHDINGLITKMGGNGKFVSWLDTLFAMKSNEKGMIGQYAHGNEPSHHLAYLYNYAGEAWKTQFLTHKILTGLYSATPDGLAGNEDCGQMSAWFVMSAMGFYSVAPGQPSYLTGSPLFEKTTINLENGRKFVIRANHVSSQNIYIQSAKLNGSSYTRSYISHQSIMDGGELIYEMGPAPNKSWGTNINDRPVSDNGSPVVSPPYLQSGDTLFLDSTTITLGCDSGNSIIRYTLNGSEPGEQSAIYTKPIELKESAVLKMKSFHQYISPGLTVTYKFTKAVLNEPVIVTDNKPGLNFDYFERFFVSAEDLNQVDPVSSGRVPDFDIGISKNETYFGIRFTGYFRAQKDGIYTFYLISNDGSRLYIDDKEVIENDANHGAIEEPGSIGLKAGPHKIRVNYFQCGGGKTLKVNWSGPGFGKRGVF